MSIDTFKSNKKSKSKSKGKFLISNCITYRSDWANQNRKKTLNNQAGYIKLNGDTLNLNKLDSTEENIGIENSNFENKINDDKFQKMKEDLVKLN